MFFYSDLLQLSHRIFFVSGRVIIVQITYPISTKIFLKKDTAHGPVKDIFFLCILLTMTGDHQKYFFLLKSMIPRMTIAAHRTITTG